MTKSLIIIARLELASSLVARRMRVYIGINEERDQVRSIDFPESCLALASSSIIAETGWLCLYMELLANARQDSGNSMDLT